MSSHAYAKNCKYDYYYDEYTQDCHPCSECLPPHQALRFCVQCPGSTTTTTSYDSTSQSSSSSTVVSWVVGAVAGLVSVLVIVGLVICLHTRRRRRERQQQQVHECVTDSLIGNGNRKDVVELTQTGNQTVHGVSVNGICDPSIQHAASNCETLNGHVEPTSSNIQLESGCPLRMTATAPSSVAQPFILQNPNDNNEAAIDVLTDISQPADNGHGMICPSCTFSFKLPNETPCKRYD